MAVKIGSNIASLQAQRRLGDASSAVGSVYARLSSGQRINRPSDDAAGAAIADTLRSNSRVFTRGVRNVNDGISALNIADAAVGELVSITTRILELAEQAGSGAYSAVQRKALDGEAQALKSEYLRVIQSTQFNDIRLLDGTVQGLRIQAGYGAAGGIASSLGGKLGTGGVSISQSLTANSAASDIFSADLNGDGNLDIVTANGGGATISVNLGTGSGGFGASTNYTVGGSVSALTGGDFNNDGIIDIAAADTTGSVKVVLGNGRGGFGTGAGFAASVGALAAGDLNGDGNLDIVSVKDAVVQVLTGNGRGSFSVSNNIDNSASGASSVAIGDMNNDGRLDIVSNSNFGAVRIYRNNGSTWTAVDPSGAPVGTNLVLTDLNNDARLDIVVGSDDGGSNETISTVMATAAGGYNSNSVDTAAFAGGYLRSGDFNGDGLQDIAAASTYPTSGSAIVSIGLGDGAGSFSITNSNIGITIPGFGTAPVDAVFGLGIGDYNGDGVLDYATTGGGAFFAGLGSTRDGVNPMLSFSLKTQADALQAIAPLNRQLTNLSTQRGIIGAFQSRLNSANQTVGVQSEQVKAAESRIRDADVAAEAGRLALAQVRQQAASAVLAQANLQPRIALDLLRL